MSTERPKSIFRSVKDRSARFARIDNAILNDDRLSFRERGIAAYLLGKPDDWSFSAKSLSAATTEGVSALETAIRNLTALGYVTRIRSRSASGQVRSRLVFHESPTSTFRQSAPTGTLPSVGQPTGRSADGRQTAGVSNDGLTNNGLTNDSLKNHPPKEEDFASLSQSGTAPAKIEAKPAPSRDALIAEIVAFASIKPTEAALSKSIAGRLNRVLDEILTCTPDATPVEIRKRGDRIARKWPNARTIETLAKHWSAFSKSDGSWAESAARYENVEPFGIPQNMSPVEPWPSVRVSDPNDNYIPPRAQPLYPDLLHKAVESKDQKPF